MVQETNLLMEVPKASRPRERLDQFGEKALATHELLAIILRTGAQGQQCHAAGVNGC